MNTRFFCFCAGLSCTALAFLSPAHSQGPPPPPPPLGQSFNGGGGSNAAPPTVIFPQQDPATNPALPPVDVTAAPISVRVDVVTGRHDISPLIYSVSGATPAQLQMLNTMLNSQAVGPGLVDFRAVQPPSLRRVFSNDASADTQALRNRATRLLWDPHYGSATGAGAKIAAGNGALIPRLQSRLKSYPAGTKSGITGYDWGADSFVGGATAQADALGIYGREGLGIAARIVPDTASPAFKAMQMYRNYNGKGGAFGSISVSDATPDPDTLSSFAAVRRSDGALTVMVINKSVSGPAPVSLRVSHFVGTAVQAWQLTSANVIAPLPGGLLQDGQFSAVLPAQSVTLFVVPAAAKR